MYSKPEIKYIEKLLEAFFEGTTNTTDEKELYRFFNSNEVPEHLMSYKPVFEYFETGIREEYDTLPEEEFRIKPPQKKHWIMWASVAASLILIVFVGVQPGISQKQFNPYEGSYIVRNGVRIDDPDEIRPQIEIISERISRRQHEIEYIIKKATDTNDRKKEILNSLEEQQNAILVRIEDEDARNKIKEIMKINPID